VFSTTEVGEPALVAMEGAVVEVQPATVRQRAATAIPATLDRCDRMVM
jgi:hypothetical protein